ncbi:MAG: sigma-E factor regulatory protein RseB domain-containing protein, partial [Casimicrobiaceae bacterium]
MGAIAVLAAALASPVADAQGFAAQWMMRVTQAARTLNYSGTILVRQGARFDTFRLAHMFDNEQESEKLLS